MIAHRAAQRLAMLVAATLFTVALISAPPIAAKLLTADGTIDSALVRGAMAAISALSGLTGLGVASLAWSATARRGLGWLMQSALALLAEGRRLLVAVVLLGLVGLAAAHDHARRPAWVHRTTPSAQVPVPDHAIPAHQWFVRVNRAIAHRWPPLAPEIAWGSPTERVDRGRRVLRGTLTGHVGGTMAWKPGTPIAWNAARDDVLFGLHRQLPVVDLVQAWRVSGDEAFLDAGIDLAVQWLDHHDHRTAVLHPSPWRWNDDTTAQRTRAWLTLLAAHGEARPDDPTLAQRLLWPVVRHADWLADPDHYNQQTNHGLMQDLALLSAAIALPELDHEGRWRRTALTRFSAYIQRATAEDGALLELSPHYHLYALEMALWFVHAAEHAEIEIDPPTLDRVRKMADFVQILTLPDGTLPVIGDTDPFDRPGEGWPWSELPHWPELRTIQHSDSPWVGARWSPAGYDVVRWRSPRGGQATLTFMLGDVSHAHRHPDKLAIILSDPDGPLLVGPGYPPYFDMTARTARIATRQQNTVAISGEDQPFIATRALAHSVDLLTDGGLRAVAAGEISPRPNTTHRRTVYVGPDPDQVVLIDDIDADRGEHEWSFRAAPGLMWTSTPDGRAGLRDSSDERLRVAAWSLDPDGWNAVAIRVEGDRIRYSHAGSTVRMLTHLSLAPGPQVALRGRTASWGSSVGGYRLEPGDAVATWRTEP